MARFEGKNVLITGPKGGLGSAVTQAFLDAGARVAGVSRSIRSDDFPSPNFFAIPGEISSLEAARQIVAAAQQRLGAIHALVHLVGAWEGGRSVAETDDATFERMLQVNLWSAIHMIRAVLPGMQASRQGRILAVGSKAALEPQASSCAYNASKAALLSLIRTTALENRRFGISANIVLPATIDTPANRQAMPQADPSQWVQPAQIAALLLHLASEESEQISGAAIPIYGHNL
ncbi:MAG: SDR family NAD(P)-dependent oxidoreductase [Bryobacteraceae bacterium]|nr:SDR family NAD(P)-dependent oxidoreductase [Bryobacteraceae bacterium]MDW8379183.1 SDR family NAD(P)-dependent oxidoreductase [Bryobacterales bacterium]